MPLVRASRDGLPEEDDKLKEGVVIAKESERREEEPLSTLIVKFRVRICLEKHYNELNAARLRVERVGYRSLEWLNRSNLSPVLLYGIFELHSFNSTVSCYCTSLVVSFFSFPHESFSRRHHYLACLLLFLVPNQSLLPKKQGGGADENLNLLDTRVHDIRLAFLLLTLQCSLFFRCAASALFVGACCHIATLNIEGKHHTYA